MADVDSVERLKEENQRLTQELKQKLFELSILYEISSSISYNLDYDDFLRLVMESLHKIVDYDICTYLLILEGEKKAKMVMRIAHAVEKHVVENIQHKVIGALASLRGKTILEDDIILDLKGEVLPDNAAQAEINSSFDVPLFARDEAVGILNVSSTKNISYPMVQSVYRRPFY